MKNKEQTLCREQMKDDLMKVFREISGNYSCRYQTEAYEQTVQHPAPRFYIDARRAHCVISPMRRGDYSQLDKLSSPLKRQMYLDLFDTVQRLYQKSTYWGKSLYYVLQFAILEPAPRFYIGADMMRLIWKERTRRTRKEAGNEADNN